MILFVTQVMLLVKDGIKKEREWLEMEYKCRSRKQMEIAELNVAQESDKHNPLNIRSYIRSTVTAISPSLRLRQNQTDADQLQYEVFRREFLLERNTTTFEPTDENHRVPESFNFARYLSLSLGQTLAHSVHLNISTWIMIAALDVFFYVLVVLLREHMVQLAWAWTATIYLVLIANTYVDHHLDSVEHNIASSRKDEARRGTEGEGLLSRSENSARDEILPAWTQKNKDVKKGDNQFDALFWHGRKGPKLYTSLFQMNLLFTSIYMALLCSVFAPALHLGSSLGHLLVYLAVSLFPMAILLFVRSDFIALMAKVTAVGTHRKPQVVSTVLREEKTALVIKSFVFANEMILQAKKGFKELEKRDFVPAEEISEIDKERIDNVFSGFDTEKDDNVTVEELKTVLRSLMLMPKDEKEDDANTELVNSIAQQIDMDNNGEISKQEFINFYVNHIQASSMSRSIDEKADDLFHQFDESGDGEITIGELNQTLNAFNFDFSVDETGELISELDRQGNGTVGKEEFRQLLHTYENFLVEN